MWDNCRGVKQCNVVLRIVTVLVRVGVGVTATVSTASTVIKAETTVQQLLWSYVIVVMGNCYSYTCNTLTHTHTPFTISAVRLSIVLRANSSPLTS